MTKEEFVKKVNALRAQKALLEKEYIESNTQFPIGSKIKVTTPEGKVRYGLVKFNVVEYDDVVPYAVLIMKNGEESQRRIGISNDMKVELEG